MAIAVTQDQYDKMVAGGVDPERLIIVESMPKPPPGKPVRWVNREARRAAKRARRRKR